MDQESQGGLLSAPGFLAAATEEGLNGVGEEGEEGFGEGWGFMRWVEKGLDGIGSSVAIIGGLVLITICPSTTSPTLQGFLRIDFEV